LPGQEYARTHNGRVISGVVIEKTSSSGAEGSRRVRSPRWWHHGLVIATEGFTIHDLVARMILTGSPDVWIVEYRYACERPIGCHRRDFVPEALWRQLQTSQTVNVRISTDENDPGRIDENPRWVAAIVDLTIAGALLLVAWLVAGRSSSRKERDAETPAGTIEAPA
jgi:hypothetical protein